MQHLTICQICQNMSSAERNMKRAPLRRRAHQRLLIIMSGRGSSGDPGNEEGAARSGRLAILDFGLVLCGILDFTFDVVV